jgi:hypothetical protein
MIKGVPEEVIGEVIFWPFSLLKEGFRLHRADETRKTGYEVLQERGKATTDISTATAFQYFTWVWPLSSLYAES